MSTETRSRKFTSTYISALKPGASICDISDPAVPGLVLRVAVSGSKAWLFRFKWEGSATRIALGKFPAVGLSEARQLALKNREWLDKGIDPRRAIDRFGGERRAARPPSPATDARSSEPSDLRDFEKRRAATPRDQVPRPDPDDHSTVLFITHEYIQKSFKAQGKNSKEACRMLRADVLPQWHWRDGRTITSREVIELLDKVVERGAPVMANNLAQMLGHIFKFAIHRGTLENSPVQLLYRPGGKPRRRKRVLSDEELRSFVTNIDSICRTKRRKHVLMVLLLTMQRRGELARAEWTEFDFDNRRWKIPASHSKNKREHAVPLTRWAIVWPYDPPCALVSQIYPHGALAVATVCPIADVSARRPVSWTTTARGTALAERDGSVAPERDIGCRIPGCIYCTRVPATAQGQATSVATFLKSDRLTLFAPQEVPVQT